MSGRPKPGHDTLVFFWCAILPWILGTAATSLGTLFQINETMGVNILGLTVPHLIGFGWLAGAVIFSVAVAHKIIAMLIYLVHHQR